MMMMKLPILPCAEKLESFFSVLHQETYEMKCNLIPVSYTHLTLPTNREV